MNFDNQVVLITGANRGIGKALVEACLRKNVRKVYACSRDLKKLPNFNDDRVIPISLDITHKGQIEEAKLKALDTQILINNAGVINPGSLFESKAEGLREDMELNYFGTIEMMRAFVPLLEKNKNPRIINIVSIAAYCNFPFIAGYSASKSALYSASQAARIELSQKGICVHIVSPGAIDTDMNKGSEMEMTSPEDVAESILNEVEKDNEDIIPDKIGKHMFSIWKESPRALEKLAHDLYFAGSP